MREVLGSSPGRAMFFPPTVTFIVTGRPYGSVALWSECSHGLREVLGSSPGRAMCSPPMTFGGQCGSVLRLRAAKGLSSVPAWFRADSGTNLIKQGEIVTGRPCGSVDQWSECSHGLREVLGSSPGRAMCFHPPVTFGGQCGSVLGLRVAKRLSRRFRHGSGQIRGRI